MNEPHQSIRNQHHSLTSLRHLSRRRRPRRVLNELCEQDQVECLGSDRRSYHHARDLAACNGKRRRLPDRSFCTARLRRPALAFRVLQAAAAL